MPIAIKEVRCKPIKYDWDDIGRFHLGTHHEDNYLDGAKTKHEIFLRVYHWNFSVEWGYGNLLFTFRNWARKRVQITEN